MEKKDYAQRILDMLESAYTPQSATYKKIKKALETKLSLDEVSSLYTFILTCDWNKNNGV